MIEGSFIAFQRSANELLAEKDKKRKKTAVNFAVLFSMMTTPDLVELICTRERAELAQDRIL